MKTSLFQNSQLFSSAAMEAPDLDMTPVMNMFVILVPFLISMVVFTNFSVLKCSLPPNAGAGLSALNEKPKQKMTIVVTADFLLLTVGETMLDSIAMTGSKGENGTILEKIHYHRSKMEIQDEAIVAVRDKVKFEQMVTIMDLTREAGFTKLGLSNATQNPDTGV